jgi:hypothetical protein
MSTSSAEFSKKVNELGAHIAKANGKISAKESCVPSLLIAAIATPIVVWALFFFINPSFVQRKDADGKYVRCGKKIAMWTAIVTLILWVAMYMFTYCQGYDSASAFCKRK